MGSQVAFRLMLHLFHSPHGPVPRPWLVNTTRLQINYRCCICMQICVYRNETRAASSIGRTLLTPCSWWISSPWAVRCIINPDDSSPSVRPSGLPILAGLTPPPPPAMFIIITCSSILSLPPPPLHCIVLFSPVCQAAPPVSHRSFYFLSLPFIIHCFLLLASHSLDVIKRRESMWCDKEERQHVMWYRGETACDVMKRRDSMWCDEDERQHVQHDTMIWINTESQSNETKQWNETVEEL